MPHKDKSAANEYAKAYQKKKRQQRIQAGREALGNKCVKCGTEDNLQFDHIDPNTKSFTISSKCASVSEEKFWHEVKKCQLLCFDCHVEKSRTDGSHNVPKHGTHSMYSFHGCRCTECTLAQRNYMREYNGRVRER